MNPRITSYQDIEGKDGEARPKAETPAGTAEHIDHEGRGVAIPTYSERHPHRGAERVELGEPVVEDLVKEARVTLTDDEDEKPSTP